MSNALRRKLLGDESRCLVYLVIGFVMFFTTVVNGFWIAMGMATSPMVTKKIEQPRVRSVTKTEKPPKRYVEPARLEFPIY